MQRLHSSPVVYFSPMMESQTYFLASTGSPGNHSVCPSVFYIVELFTLSFKAENTSSCLFLFYQRTYSSGLGPKINKKRSFKKIPSNVTMTMLDNWYYPCFNFQSLIQNDGFSTLHLWIIVSSASMFLFLGKLNILWLRSIIKTPCLEN